MARKKHPPDYDGPTINGRPALSVREIQKWFSDEGCIIPMEDAAAIAGDLNHCAFVSFFWKSTPSLRAARRTNPSRLSMQRTYTALKTLQNDLPVLIANTLKVHPKNPPPSLAPIEALLKTANNLEPCFRKYAPRGRGREPDLWHNIARNVGRKIAEAFAKHSKKRTGLGKPTSPAIKILKLTMSYLEEHHSEDAIVDAVRARRARAREGRGKAS
jgi:hypothetical protein